MKASERLYVKREEAMALLGVGNGTFYRMLNSGSLKKHFLGNMKHPRYDVMELRSLKDNS